MYRHANTNIDPPQFADHDSISTGSSERQRRQIPLAFTNTTWGREYVSNPNWEHDNLGRNNSTTRQASRSRLKPDDKDNKPLPDQTRSSNACEIEGSLASSSPSTTTTSLNSGEVFQEYSVMKAWGFFSRSFPIDTKPTSPYSPDADKRKTLCLVKEACFANGPWSEMLMRWDDFERWQLEMLRRSWYQPSTP